jgi:hypothetical protein
MLESLRGLGYSTESAIADTLDNSVSASATKIDIFFYWAGGESFVAIVDNGHGMSCDELESAMRLGDRDPLEKRQSGDLGRFGLGLKTSAFSQGRRLTVASRAAGQDVACFGWDLDMLASAGDGGWHLLEGADDDSFEAMQLVPLEGTGTLVLWEVLDRLVPQGTNEQMFLDAIDRVERHLAMVFHRYLEEQQPRLRININGKAVRAWTPFIASASAPNWSSPIEQLRDGSGSCVVRCHVLPHRDRLTKTEYEAAAGISGWNAQQGFYVYRNERLLVPGSWLGLGNPKPWVKDEIHRLARIQLDFTNASDAEWKIDIRKSIAKPPHGMRHRLSILADDTRRRARAAYAHRGQIVRRPNEEPIFQAWEAVVDSGVTRYRINREHPAVRSVLDSPLSIDGGVDAMLKLLESTIPVQRIWLDTVEDRGLSAEAPPSAADEEEARQMLEVLYRSLLRQHYSPQRARERLLRTEPFYRFPQLVEALPDQLLITTENPNENT